MTATSNSPLKAEHFLQKGIYVLNYSFYQLSQCPRSNAQSSSWTKALLPCTFFVIVFFSSQGQVNSKLMVLIAENVWSWDMAAFQQRTVLASTARRYWCQMLLREESCHIKCVPMERLLSCTLFSTSSSFFKRVKAALLARSELSVVQRWQEKHKCHRPLV